MSLFALFLSALIVPLLFFGNYVLGAFFLVLLLYLLIFRIKKKKLIYYIVLISLIILTICLISKFIHLDNSYYLVIERKEGYCLVFNGLETFYLKVDKESTYDLLDIIKVIGSKSRIDFVTLESQFNFNYYLFSKNVDFEINSEEISYVFNFPFGNYFLKTNFLNQFKDDLVRDYLSSILFSYSVYDNEKINALREIQVIAIISLTGTYLNFALYSLKKLYFLKYEEKESTILAFLTFLPFLLINLNKFVVIRVIAFYLFNFVNKFYLNRRFERIEVISLVGLVFILFSPRIVFQSSFYISFTIYYLLALIGNNFNNFKNIEKKFLMQIVIFLIVLPFTISNNYSFNILSIIIIFIISPLNKLIFIIGVLSFFFLPYNAVDFILKYLTEFIILFDKLNLNIHVPEFSSLLYLIYYALFILFFYYFEIKHKRKLIPIVLFELSLLILYIIPLENSLTYQVTFLNVGQGDSTLVRINNHSYLIDTGGLTYNDIATNSLIPFLKKNRIYSLDAVFITHYDFDHSGGYESLASHFKVGNVYDYSNFDEFESSIFKVKNLNVYNELWDEENDKSLVLKFELNDTSFLIMGDAPSKIEDQIIKDNPTLDIDVLKVGHHGSKTSSSLDFLKVITPKEAVISCGKNNIYHHPNEETLTNLKKVNARIRRTDLEGSITYKNIFV